MKSGFLLLLVWWLASAAALGAYRKGGVQAKDRTKDAVRCVKETTHPRDLTELLKEYDDDFFLENPYIVTAAMTQYRQFQKPELALELFDAAMAKGMDANLYTYNAAITAAEKQGDWRRGLALFDELKDQGLGPDIISYNAVIAACGIGGQWKKAVELFDTMHLEDLEPDVVTYSSVIGACGKGQQWEKAFEYLGELRKEGMTPSALTYGAMVNACGEGRRWATAKELVDCLVESGLDPDLELYTNLIGACGKRRQPARAWELFESFSSSSTTSKKLLEADDLGLVYTATIQALYSGGWHKQALDVGDDLRRSCLEVDAKTYTILINAAEKREAWAKMLLLYDEMVDGGLLPTPTLYTRLIAACGRKGKWKKAVEIFERALNEHPGYAPSAVTYNALIGTLAEPREWQKALYYFYEMEHSGLKPDLLTYSVTMKACERAGQSSRVFELFDDLLTKRTPPRSSLKPDLQIYSTLLAACASAKEWQKALDFFDDIKHSGLEPNDFTYTALIHAVARGGQFPERGFDLFDEMRQKGIPLKTITYNAVVSACDGWDQALGYVDGLRDRGFDVPVATYNEILNRGPSLEGCDFQKGLDLFETIRTTRNLLPDAGTFDATVAHCARHVKWETAVEILHSMPHGRHLKPRGATYHAAIVACLNGGQYGLAFDLFDELLQRKGATPLWQTYRVLADASHQEGAPPDKVMAFFDKARVLGGLRDEAPAYVAMVSACARAGDFSKAATLLDEFRTRTGLNRTLATYEALLDVCGSSEGSSSSSSSSSSAAAAAAAGDSFSARGSEPTNELAAKAPELLRDARDRGIRPTARTYAKVIAAVAKGVSYDEALGVFQDAKTQLVGTKDDDDDAVLSCALVAAAAKAGRWQEAVELVEAAVSPDGPALNAVVCACERAGQDQQAVEFFDKLRRAGEDADLQTLTAAIAACGRLGRWKAAHALFSHCEQNLDPDVATYNAIIAAADTKDTAVALYHRLLERPLDPNEATSSALLAACQREGLPREDALALVAALRPTETLPSNE